MRITKWGEYGLLFCIYLAERDRRDETSAALSPPVGAAELADAHHIPTQYAQQILHRLRKGDVVSSIRGPRGGFILRKPPGETTMLEILTAAEGTTFDLMCDTNPIFPGCENGIGSGKSGCGLRYVWQDLKTAIDRVLETRTLEQVMLQHSSARSAAETAELVTIPHRVS